MPAAGRVPPGLQNHLCSKQGQFASAFCYHKVMQKNITQPTENSVDGYLSSISDRKKQSDAKQLLKIMQEATKELPVLWGPSIIGFGNYHYKYASGREGDTPVVSFAVRKNAITLYGVLFYEQNEENVKLAQQLGPHSHGKGCLYIKDLNAIDQAVLKKMLRNAYAARSGTLN